MYKKCLYFIAVIAFTVSAAGYSQNSNMLSDKTVYSAFHSISSETISNTINYICRDEFRGRLTGTPGFNNVAKWVCARFSGWDLEGAGDSGSYLQAFDNPYTLVSDQTAASLRIPISNGACITKPYRLEKDFIPGSTSDTGEVTAEVVYAGYGITAQELGYDDYAGVDVKGKIVLVEREVPVSAERHPELFKKWRKYSFHQYKVHNAREHGAAGMLYIYHIANPNCDFIPGLVLTYINDTIVDDLLAGTEYTHKQVLETIWNKTKPCSFSTGKVMTIKNTTEHHPEGVAYNVLGYFEGTDPKLKNEVIVLSAHLDHVGANPLIVPGANDNASGVAVLMDVARALSPVKGRLKRSVLFAFFGAEEQGVRGSDVFIRNFPLQGKKIVLNYNLDGVGRGDRLVAVAGTNYPKLYQYIDEANDAYVHRDVKPVKYITITRPRLDAVRFIWEGIPSVSFYAAGIPLGRDVYHKTGDNPSVLTPEIMEDLAQILFGAVYTLAVEQGSIL